MNRAPHRHLAPLTGAPDERVALVAKSGIALVERFATWAQPPAIIDGSRLDSRPLRWMMPLAPGVRRVAIVETRASTGLTQQRVARLIQEQHPDPDLEVTFGCLSAETRLGAQRQHWRVADHGLVPADWDLSTLPHRYLVALVGYPGCGKSFLRRVLGVDCDAAVLRWGAWAAAHARRMLRLGDDVPLRLDDMQAFYQQIERRAPSVLALTALHAMTPAGRTRPWLVVDGIKTRDQLVTLSYGARRPPIIVAVVRDEAERRRIVAQRQDADDRDDAARCAFLRTMGLDDLIAMADVVIDTTGSQLEYDRRSGTWVRLTVTPRLLRGFADLWQALGWQTTMPLPDALAWRCAAALDGGTDRPRGVVQDLQGNILATRTAAPVTAADAVIWTDAAATAAATPSAGGMPC